MLVTEGFTSVEEVAFVPLSDLATIEGFDESVAEELHTRAQNWLETKAAEQAAKLKALGIEETLIEFVNNHPDLKAQWLEKFGENKVCTLDDFADLSSAELLDILPNGVMNLDEAGELIMAARASWE